MAPSPDFSMTSKVSSLTGMTGWTTVLPPPEEAAPGIGPPLTKPGPEILP